MKRLFAGIALAFFSLFASATTFTPIQLLNPAGSTSGQVIVSSGPTTVAAWGGIGVSGINALAANTVLANATAASASPTAFAMPSCSTSTSALNWTSGTGFTCGGSGFAALAGATFTGAITPSQTAGIVGTTTNNNANTGSVGELISSSVASGSAVTVSTTGAAVNVTSISLTAGDWDVTGSIYNNTNGITGLRGWTSTTSATTPTQPNNGGETFIQLSTGALGAGAGAPIGSQRFSFSSTTTVYLSGTASFSSGTAGIYGFVRARRIR